MRAGFAPHPIPSLCLTGHSAPGPHPDQTFADAKGEKS